MQTATKILVVMHAQLAHTVVHCRHCLNRTDTIFHVVKGIGDATCKLCPAGYFNDVYNAPQCKACAPGRYSDGDGGIICNLCGIG